MSNENREEIAVEMRKVHDQRVWSYQGRNAISESLGPLLLRLWMGNSGTSRFHDVYTRFSYLFHRMIMLKKGKWKKHFVHLNTIEGERPMLSLQPNLNKRIKLRPGWTNMSSSFNEPRPQNIDNKSDKFRIRNPLDVKSRRDRESSIPSIVDLGHW